VIEYYGGTIRAMSMEGRMTVCNMSIECGARAGLIAPDQVTFDYLQGRPMAPQGADWDTAVADWKTLKTDLGAAFDRQIEIDATQIQPSITYGTHPGMVVEVDESIPTINGDESIADALDYMRFQAGENLADERVDVVFIGSCTNSRIGDLREAAGILKNRKVAAGLRMLVVPGSEETKSAAEAEGLDQIFKAAGAEWREPGCSMCLGMNGDIAQPGELVVSTSNRNFKGRQGTDSRTILASPLTAAACAVTGKVSSPMQFLEADNG
jgi:3-isopropylmalate/(R)-2-methylmalate dehydratase large subunit